MYRKKTIKKEFLKATLAIIVTLAFIMPGSSIFASETFDNTIVSVDPPMQMVEKGETFNVDVYIGPVNDQIAGISIDNIFFNAILLQANSVTFQGFFDPYETMQSAGTIDNTNGEITYIYEFTFPAEEVATPGVWITISFTAQQTIGLSEIDLEYVLLLDGDANVITIEVNDGMVQIGEGYTLIVHTVGNGLVTLDPAGGLYAEGTSVSLTAVPDSDWTFDHWSGDLNGSDNPETIIMDDNKDVTATFTEGDAPFTEIILDGTMGENGWYVSVVTVTLLATDEGSGVESTWYRIDDGDWILYNGTSFVVSEDGEHTIEFYSIDFNGNIESPNTSEFKIDTILPVTTHEFDGVIGEEGWFVSNVTVTLSAEDAMSGVNYIIYKINNGIWTNYTEPFTVTEDGEHTLYYYSVDFAGNIEPTIEVEFKIDHDTQPPVTIHDFEGITGGNNWYTSNVLVTLTAEDDSAGVASTYYKLDGGEWETYEILFVVSDDGLHTLSYYSIDFAGNVEDTNEVDLKIDQTPPTIELSWDEDNSKIVADVDDETSGIDRVDFYVNDEYIGTATESPYEYEVTNPKNGDMAHAIAFDNAGNLKESDEVEGQSQDQDTTFKWTFLIGRISNVEESENIITAQAIRLRYMEVSSTGITVGLVKMKPVKFSSDNLLAGLRSFKSFGRMSLVFGIFKGGIIINDG